MSEKNIKIKFETAFDAFPFEKSGEIHVMTTLEAPLINEEVERSTMDIVCVVDQSGSMSGGKIDLTRKTLKFIISQMSAKDRLAVVLFESRIRILFGLKIMTDEGKKEATKMVETIRARGGTHLSGGLFAACKLMKNRQHKNEVSSILLLTDGQAGPGMRDAKKIVKMLKGEVRMTDDIPIVDNEGVSSRGYGRVQRVQQVSKRNFNFRQVRQQIPLSRGMPRKRVMQQPIMQQQVIQQVQPIQQIQQVQPIQQIQQVQPMQQVIQQVQPIQQKIQEVKPIGESKEDKNTVVDDPFFNYTTIISSINCFGYGKDASADFLKEIADAAKGNYFFIENNEVVAEAFINCIGGLLTTVGTKLKLTLQSTNEAKIKKVHTGYPQKCVEKDYMYEVEIPDIQSEEKRDILLVCEVPKLGKETLKYEMLDIELKFHHVTEKKEMSNKLTGLLCRPKDAGVEKVNQKIDQCRNRILCTDVLKESASLGQRGKYEDAKKKLDEAINTITKRNTYNSEFNTNLVEDLKEAKKGMTGTTYSRGGNQFIQTQISSHMYQRCTKMSSKSQKSYVNRGRSMLMKKYKK